MDNFVKIPATNYRLFISNVINLRQETNAASETVFFLEESQVKNVIIQGIVVYARSFPEKTYLVLDDNTGTIRCVQFLERLNTIRHQMTIGDLLRIKGRLGIYQNNLQIVTKGNPYIIDNFDEEIIWAKKTFEIWNQVYTRKIVKTPMRAMQMPRHVSTNKCSLELKIVSSVKDAGKTEVHYQEILSMFPDENKKDLHTAILTLIEKAFLEPFSSDSPPQTTLYEVNEGPFHPRELIWDAFKNSGNRPIHISELRGIAKGKFDDDPVFLSKFLQELIETNKIYERETQEYALIS